MPDEISVAGFGDTDYYSTLFELTSVRQPMAEIGRRAVERVTARLRGEQLAPPVPVRPRLLPGHFGVSERAFAPRR